jgi:pimeloyl-ACP methyl ester carboxylesterase
MQTYLIHLDDSQILEVVTEGDPRDSAIVLHHGALGSSENMAPLFRAAGDRGYFAIGITRPGYAASTRREGRRAHDYYFETQKAIEYFQVKQFVSLGWSSGGPAAISDLQDGRCKGAVTIAGDAPRISEDWDTYIQKYPPKNGSLEDFEFPPLEDFRTCKPDQIVHLLGEGLSRKDTEICTGEFRSDLSHAMNHGLASGDFGALDDFESDASPWGIDLEKMMKQVAVFQGDEDRLCTPAHGYFLAEKLGNAELFLESGEGHISLMYNKSSRIIEKAIDFLNQ